MTEAGRPLPPPSSVDRAVILAGCYTVVVVALRMQVLTVNAGLGAVPSFTTTLCSAADHFLIGSGLAILVLLSRGVLAAAAVRLLIGAVLTADVAAFAYESIFRRLPTRGVFFYLHDLRELAPSLFANGPLVLLALQILFVVMVMGRLTSRLRRANRPLLPPLAAWLTVTGAVALAVLLRVVALQPAAVHPSRARAPLAWLAESWLRRDVLGSDRQAALQAEQILEFQYQIGIRPPFGTAAAAAPLCAALAPAGDAPADLVSAIVVILESVGSRELAMDVDGEALMPALRAFADRHHLVADVKAAGTKSVSAMPAVFAGLPPQSSEHLLHRVPLPSMQGFPTQLVAHGYRTAYFHGADLNWEFQRSFLRMMGMQEIFERDPRTSTPVYGWGYADEIIFHRMRDWITEHRRSRAVQPFFAALFTLSSHDPYDLPPDWPRRFDEQRAESRQYESLAYLDHQLGEFLSWYEREEAPRGTVLMLVGDHCPHLFNTTATPLGPVYRFEVPLVVAAPRRMLVATEAVLHARRGAQHDVPATLMASLGLPHGQCDQGLDLLAPAAFFPDDRVLYSVGGEDLEEIQVWAGDEHVLVDRLFRGVRRLDDRGGVEVSERVRGFLEILLPLNSELLAHDAYAPRMTDLLSARAPLPRVQRPLVVSHRGKLEVASEAALENRPESVARALATGFDAVEVDLQMSRDGVAIVHHDASFPGADGVQRSLLDFDFHQLPAIPSAAVRWTSFAELLTAVPRGDLVVELKPQPDFKHQLHFAETVAAQLRDEAPRRRIIADSFSLVQVSTLEPICACEVGWDLPYQQPLHDDFLRAALLADVDWLFMEHSVLSAEAIARAHRFGLRVMAYTVNETRDVTRLAPELPDGIITDSVEILALFAQDGGLPR